MIKVSKAECNTCPLIKGDFVGSWGPPDPKIIVVGDAPHSKDVGTGVPFTSEGGRYVRALLNKEGYDDIRDVRYMFAIKCYAHSNNEEAYNKCKPALLNEISNFNKEVRVLVLGRKASQSLGLKTLERWEIIEGRYFLGGISPSEVMSLPSKAIYVEKLVEKFAKGPQHFSFDFSYELNKYPSLGGDYDKVCIDIETTGLKWYRDDIFLVGIRAGGKNYIFDKEVLHTSKFMFWLKAFTDKHKEVIGGHNYKFDTLFLHRKFGSEAYIGWDTICMANVYHEHWHKSLKNLATYFFDAPDYEKEIKTWLKEHKEKTYDKVPPPMIREYLAKDLTYNLELGFLQELIGVDPYVSFEIPQLNMLCEVERGGFCVDTKRIEQEKEKMGRDIKVLENFIIGNSQGAIKNPRSLRQVADYIFEVQGRKVQKKTPTGKPQVNDEVLRKHSDLPVVKALINHRRISGLKSSYLDNIENYTWLDKLGNYKVSPVYRTWNVITHRLSAVEPAIQTIPHKDKAKDSIGTIAGHIFEGNYGNRIKNCFVASPGNILVGGDGKGWEVACATAQSGDKFLTDLFVRGVDPHGGLCDKLFGPGWTKAQRVKEKNIFFGWIYGGKPTTLAREAGLPLSDVLQVVDFLENTLVGLKEWRLRIIEQAKTGIITLPVFNYNYHFDLITKKVVKDLPKNAVNYSNQGLGSILISKAAIIAQPEIKKLGGSIVVLVHDFFGADVPEKFVGDAAGIIRKSIGEAGSSFSTSIPWRADIEVGYRWGEMKEYDN